jgi:hypothetical protein
MGSLKNSLHCSLVGFKIPYIAVLWCLKLLLFVIYYSRSHNIKNKMSTPESLDKATAVSKSPSSVKKVPVTPDTTSPDQAAKPVKKKIKKTPQTDGATSQADSAAKDHSSQELHRNPKPVSNRESKTLETIESSKSQAVSDNAPPPKYKNPGHQSADGAKKIMKKKPKPAVDSDKINVPEQDKQPQDEAKKVKKKTKPPATGNGDSEKPKQVKEAEDHAQKQESDSKPSAPEQTDAPKPIKKKIKKPVAPPEPEPEPEEQDQDSQSEGQGEDENETGHDNENNGIDMQGNEDHDEGEEEEYREDQDEEQEEEDDHEEDDQDEKQSDDAEEEESDVGEPLNGATDHTDPFQDTPSNVKEGINQGAKTANGLSDATNVVSPTAQNAGKDASSGGVTDKLGGLGKSAKDLAGSAADSTAQKAKDAQSDLPGGEMLSRGTKQANGAREKARGLGGGAIDQAQKGKNKSKGIARDNVEKPEPESVLSENASNAPGKATDSLDQGKDKIGGVAGEAQGAAGDLGGNAKNNLGQTQGVVKQGKDFVNQLTNGLSLDTIKGLVGKTVNDSGNIIDESGQVLGEASGDVSMMAGKTVNDSGEVIDSGKAVGRVSDVTGKVAEQKGQDIGTAINGFTPETGGSGNVNAGGVQISVQTTKEGMNLTINIPGSFQQQ